MKLDPLKAEQLLKESRQYARTILNSLSAHIAIIDAHGMILETNRAWMEFARSNRIRMRPDTLHVNYLEVCDTALGASSENSMNVGQGIRQVIQGDIDEFVIDYPCHSPEEERWFYMRATRAVGSGPLRVVISHENISALKRAERRLLQREEELRLKTVHLEEANAALRAVLRQREADRRETEQNMLQNLREGVLPYVERLRQGGPRADQRRWIEHVTSGLEDIASPFLRRLSSLERVLTPQEIRIAALIREGRTTKEIAREWNLSVTTVNFHRRNLRSKLGLKGTAANLRTHLLSLNE